MSTNTAETMITVSYSAGFIALSYVVSLMGCVTCLELLHRRTSRSGLLNWYLLLTSSLAMGGIGIWSMHFIGNRAIILGDGSDSVQIAYNVSFTLVSLVLPILVLLIAFYAISFEEKATLWRLMVGGLLTGSAVCAMHYVGQLGIANYNCKYNIGNIIGAAIIATFSATLALSIFFRWKAAWMDSWWRRFMCACLLAGAVTGMHWTATVGTSYMHSPGFVERGSQLSRSQTVIICAALSFAACLILSACAILAGGNRRRSTTRARQLVLACAFFDSAGRIMVSPEALLPTRKVVEHYVGRTMKDDDFSRTHSAFLWAFRASRNWLCVKDIIPSMKRSLQNNEQQIKRHISERGAITEQNGELYLSFETLFKQLFCVAAQDLADELRQPLTSLGELYPEVVSTVSQVSRFDFGTRSLPRLGKGQLMFTVRQLDPQETSRFMAIGYRFAPIARVTTTLSRRIHVSSTDLSVHLGEMREYVRVNKGYPPGVHLVAFAMRPTVHEHFEVLTRKGSGISLPSSPLPVRRLSPSDMEVISEMDEWGLAACLKHLTNNSTESISSAETFRNYLYRSMLELSVALPKEISAAAKFSAHPLYAPCRRLSSSGPDECTLLTFRVVGSLDTRINDPDLTFTPLRLFRVQEQVNDGLAERERFVRELNVEFSYSAQSTAGNRTQSDNKRSNFLNFWSSPPRRNRLGRRAVSQEALVESPGGEIIISKEVRVDVAKLDDMEMQSTFTGESQISIEGGHRVNPNYVDELYGMCFAPGIRMKPSPLVHIRARSEAST